MWAYGAASHHEAGSEMAGVTANLLLLGLGPEIPDLTHLSQPELPATRLSYLQDILPLMCSPSDLGCTYHQETNCRTQVSLQSLCVTNTQNYTVSLLHNSSYSNS